MSAHRYRRNTTERSLSAQFDSRLQERLALAESRRHRRAILLRWRWTAMVLIPLACAAAWAVMPFTFGTGVRALAGSLGYMTMLMAMAQDISRNYLSFLGLGPAPAVIDVLLLVGVVSWLMWASSSDEAEAAS